METIKIQINHQKPLKVSTLASILHNEIGEEYDLNLEEIKEYFSFKSSCILPDKNFTSVIEFNLPELETRETTLKDIVFSFLNSVENLEGIISIVKVNDTILQEKAYEFYKQIIELEMDMRNVLTYIITHSNKTINEELFKNFGINKSEKLEIENMKKNYENGLFYIYFNHYSSFTKPQKLKADKIAEFLQEPNLSSFEQLKSKLEDRSLKEDRHIDFIASLKTKLEPLEKMRNAIMHIRNISDTVVRNFEMSLEDNGANKGIKTLIQEFWDSEHELLKKKTFRYQTKLATEDIFSKLNNDNGTFIFMENINNEIFEEEYSELDDFQTDILQYIEDEINILNYDISDKEYRVINKFVARSWTAINEHTTSTSTEQ